MTSHSAEQAGRIAEIWCSLMHDAPMWPIHGQYQCRTCGLRYPVPWSGAPAPAPEVRQARQPLLRTARFPVVLLAAVALAPLLRAAEPASVDSVSGAAEAFARYTAGPEHAAPWSVETVEIDASLPKLAKTGRLRALRRLLPFGRPEYQVIELDGDKTVKQEVINRYLREEVKAAEIPRSSVAITPANYRFHYKGTVEAAGSTLYAFSITPRKKREGLIKGELWLDGETGAAVRQSGYLVKRPSIFVKRIEVTRATELCKGVAEVRITHLTIDTRLVGRAELTIEERPFTAAVVGDGPAGN
jgi:hypothetical protein